MPWLNWPRAAGLLRRRMTLLDLARVLKEVIPNAHYVGGVVRNSLLGVPSSDIDITLPKAEVKPAALALAKRLKATTFEMDPELGVWRLVTREEKIQIDLTAYQGKSLKADLRRRDFAFNSLAYPVRALPEIIITPRPEHTAHIVLKNLRTTKIVDETGGLEDVANKIIRLNGRNHFREDPLRMLRAFRSSAELGFQIDRQTLFQIQKDHAHIARSAGERVKEELERLFATSCAYEQLLQMDACGLLTAVFPELEAQRTCAEVYYGPGGVLKHTLLVFKRMEWLLDNLDQAFTPFAREIVPVAQNKALYKMTALLHDVAKPATAKIKKDRLRFFYHEQQGARMARKTLQRLHYSRADIRLITAMIGEHLRPSNLASNNVLTDRGIYHFFRDLGDAGIPLLLLCWADYTSYVTDEQLAEILPHSSDRLLTIAQASRMENAGKTLRHLQVLWTLLGKYVEAPQKVRPSRIITGQDVMVALHLSPGPKVGEILEAVSLAQVEGQIVTREDALEFIRRKFAAT